MPGLDATAPNAGGDELDDLFNYDINVDEAFHDIEQRAQVQNRNVAITKSNTRPDLGIDEEVQIKAARKPVAKLDEKRLLSERGIPKLRKLTKERLKFKGKGHEFNDIARMLSLYQLWLDDLYPRAKFLDSLAMVEKLGHSKSLQVMRKDWINERKAHDAQQTDPFQAAEEQQETEPVTAPEARPLEMRSNFDNTSQQQRHRPSEGANDPENLFLSDEEGNAAGVPDEDELDALLDEVPGAPPPAQRLPPAPALSQDSLQTSPVREDDLDDLWAEHEAEQPDTAPRVGPADDFADEMDVLADLDDW